MINPYDVFSQSLKMWTDHARTFPLPLDEAKIRETFQAAADMNLKAWTQMAEQMAAMPSWMRWPAEVPGRAMTDMFDMLRPFPTFYLSLIHI